MLETAFLHMIALSHNFPRMLANEKRAAWERRPQRLLLGKTAVLLGVGCISEEIAQRCKAFGMRVLE
jgi:phosphoglycerate dehydrogenase-like enzyme